MKNAGFALKAIKTVLLVAIMAAPMAASAQFTVTDQHAKVFVQASSGPSFEPFDWNMVNVAWGDLSSQNLSAVKDAGTDVTVHGDAHFQTIATSSVVGISSSMALAFKQVTAEIPSNLNVSGQVLVTGSLTFRVDAPTDVLISGSGASFSRVLGVNTAGTTSDGSPLYMLQPVQSTNGLAHLTAGNYHLSMSSAYHPASTTSGPAIILGSDGTITVGMGKFVLPASLASNGFGGVTITAVPEPATTFLSLLGLAGIATVTRRRALR